MIFVQCLPEKVTKHFNDFVGKILEFKCPSGTDVWHVGLIGSGDNLVLQPGWSDFASSNNVSQNDMLLFKLVGGCTFEVRIFDPFGREKGGDFEEEADEDKVQEGTGTSAKTHSRKRSWGQNCNSLPLKKRLKKSDCGSPCQENEKTERKEMHIKEEYEISSVKKINSYVEKIIEEARNDNLLVLEHQTLLRRRLGLLKNDNQYSSQNPSKPFLHFF